MYVVLNSRTIIIQISVTLRQSETKTTKREAEAGDRRLSRVDCGIRRSVDSQGRGGEVRGGTRSTIGFSLEGSFCRTSAPMSERIKLIPLICLSIGDQILLEFIE